MLLELLSFTYVFFYTQEKELDGSTSQEKKRIADEKAELKQKISSSGYQGNSSSDEDDSDDNPNY